MKVINKKAFKFTLCLLPIGIIAAVLAALYSFSSYDEEMVDQILAHMPKSVFIMITVLQIGIIYTGFMGYFGYILADKVNLIKKPSFEIRNTVLTLAISVVAGLFLLSDYFIFAKVIPQVAAGYTKEAYSTMYILLSVIYGGIVEEVILRWFFMSLIAFILWKVFNKNKSNVNISEWVYMSANIAAAVLFAAGHLPATITLFGELTAAIVFRCFLLNGIPGIIFGWLYRKFGLQYAMLAHAMTHVVLHSILSLIL